MSDDFFESKKIAAFSKHNPPGHSVLHLRCFGVVKQWFGLRKLQGFLDNA